jgi:hypothetical protein
MRMNDNDMDSIMEMEPEDLSYIALFGFGIMGMVIILRAIFTLPETQSDSARYLLSTLVQSEAAIIAIVVTLSLVAVQIAASSYSSKVIEIFKKMPSLWILIFIYISAMIQGLHVLKLIEASTGNTIGLENDILLSYYLGILAFLALIPYIWNTLGSLNVSVILKILSSGITKKNVLAIEHPGYDDAPFQSVIDVITSSMMRYDEGTVAIGLNSIKSKIISIFATEDLSNPDEQLQFANNLLPYISELGYMAASRVDIAAIKRMTNAIEQIGLAAAEQNLDVLAGKIAATLGAIGGWSAENKLDFSTYTIGESLVNIEVKAVEKMLGGTAVSVALELNSIIVKLQEKQLIGTIGLIRTAINNKILTKDDIRAEQKMLFRAELEKTMAQEGWLPVLNISMSYGIFGYTPEADNARDMARDKGFPG